MIKIKELSPILITAIVIIVTSVDAILYHPITEFIMFSIHLFFILLFLYIVIMNLNEYVKQKRAKIKKLDKEYKKESERFDQLMGKLR